jgi:hypothetical protein
MDMICYEERQKEKERKKKGMKQEAPETPRFPVRGFPRAKCSCCYSLSSVERKKEKRKRKAPRESVLKSFCASRVLCDVV